MIQQLEGMKVLLERRSIRKFKSEMPPKALIEQVIEAGLAAPSAMNAQKTKILVITDKELRDELRKMNAKFMGLSENDDPFYNAPVVLIVIADKSWRPYVYDGSLVMGNMLNAATALGLANIWVHRAKEEFETPFGKDLLKKLGIQGEWEGIGHCCIGYADCPTPKAPQIKEDRVYWN